MQQALRALRNEQQRVIAEPAREAEVRPLAFAKHGDRFWPRDLPAGHLRRLDRRATDPGFQRDMFEVGQAINKAHAARDADSRQMRATDRKEQTSPAGSVPDAFGGGRQGAAPLFQSEGPYAPIAAFDPVDCPISW